MALASEDRPCSQCGAVLINVAKFCPKCGAQAPRPKAVIVDVDADKDADDDDSAPSSRRRIAGVVGASVSAVIVAIFASSKCSSDRSSRPSTTTSAALTSLEAKQREHEQRLVALKAEVATAEKQVAYARQQAALERCHAEAQQIDAEVSLRLASCMREQAAAAACQANNEQSKGKSMQDGCALGLLAAAFTGGSALLFVGGGCLAGEATGEANRVTCNVPTCLNTAASWIPSAAKSINRKGIPVCELGIEVSEVQKTFDGGLLVSETQLGAARSGIKSGDVVVRIGSSRVRTREDVNAAVGRSRNSASVQVQFVRNGSVKTTNTRVGNRDGKLVIGVGGQDVTTVPYLEVQVVTATDEAIRRGVQVGDQVVGLGKSAALRASELVRAAMGRSEPLHVVRRGKRLTISSGTP